MPAATLPRTLVLVGAGKMGGAMLEGWLGVGLDPRGVTVIDPRVSDEMAELCRSKGIALSPAEPAGSPDVLVLATKPQSLDDAAPGVDRILEPHTLVISILAGKTIGNLRARLPRARAVVRAMPNLPASIGRGATGAAASPEVSEEQRAVADTLLRCNGLVEWVGSEDLIDAVTAVSGSGPAYVFHLVECLAEAGVAAGLPADLAGRLARATIEGAGELLFRSDLSPATLRQNVTSPGGTTAAALEVLMAERGGMRDLMREAVAAAKRRAEELAG
ncbi:MAG: pyrroline-5-carboxylate reductase [Pseudomonadota bacterium]|nr:pyrroline-5-carboxylate reductase [Pseudomonadota bacterium]